MNALRVSALAWIAMCAIAAIAQSPSDREDDANTAGEDEVTAFVREIREARAEEPVMDRTISVYSTHYMIGSQRFDSLEQLLDYIKDFPPRNFSMTRLAECSARARMEELLARKAELNRAFLERVREEGRSYLYGIGIRAPNECPW
jgi:hypothetical protein